MLRRHFPELAEDGQATSEAPESANSSTRSWRNSRHAAAQNYFYLQDFKDIPEIPELDALLESCGISSPNWPDNRDYLIQAYHRTLVRLDRLIALAHLLIAGAQSDLKVNRAALERELVLQEKLKELKAGYLVEHATMELAFAKRQHGPHMLDRLNHVSGFPRKHKLALEAIENRLSVGTEQFPAIINSTQRVQRLFQGLGQLLLGGFLAAEVIKSASEWSAVYMHRDHYAFFSELALQIPGVSVEGVESLQHEFHAFELSSVSMSIAVVAGVVGIALYYRFRNRAIKHALPSSGGHHH